MAYEIINNKRSKSVIRVTGTGDTAINLLMLAADNTETIQSASITGVLSSSNGIWSVYRGNDNTGVLILELPDAVDWPLTSHDISLGNTSTANVFINNSGANGTLILTVSKQATYNPPQTGM